MQAFSVTCLQNSIWINCDATWQNTNVRIECAVYLYNVLNNRVHLNSSKHPAHYCCIFDLFSWQHKTFTWLSPEREGMPMFCLFPWLNRNVSNDNQHIFILLVVTNLQRMNARVSNPVGAVRSWIVSALTQCFSSVYFSVVLCLKEQMFVMYIKHLTASSSN